LVIFQQEMTALATIRIRFTTLFSQRIGGVSSAEVFATDVGSALRALTERYPELSRLLWSGSDALNPMMAVFLNDQLIEPGQLATPVKPGDQIDLLAAVSGGAA
jgi:molybdopterin converting factor small subunit